MATSNIVKKTETIEQGVTDTYKKIENTVVCGYKKIEDTVTCGYTRIEDSFVERFLTKEGESVEEAKKRLKRKTENR